jgi:hypothetical protein
MTLNKKDRFEYSVIEIADTLAGLIRNTSEVYYTQQEKYEMLSWLKWRVKNWQNIPYDKQDVKNCNKYDNTVKELAKATITLCKPYIKRPR